MENNNKNACVVFVFSKKYNIIEQVIRLKNAEYGCAIPFLFGFSQVLHGKV